MATTPAISRISIWIAMVYRLAPLAPLSIWDRGAAGDTRVEVGYNHLWHFFAPALDEKILEIDRVQYWGLVDR